MRRLETQQLVADAQERQAWECAWLEPGMDILLAYGEEGANSASASYVNRKEQYGLEIGAAVRVHRLGLTAVRSLDLIQRLNENDESDDMMMQLPLPMADAELRSSEERRICSSIDVGKDIDGLAPETEFPQATPLGLMKILEGFDIDVEGRTATVNGAHGKLVGPGAVNLLRGAGAEVIEIDKDNDGELQDAMDESEVVVSAVGQPGLITPDMLRDGQVVLDAGVAPVMRNGRKTTAGDVDPAVFQSEKDLHVTPHRGGAGPMTVSALFDNLLYAAKKRRA